MVRLILSRDWDRLRREVVGFARIISMMVNALIKLIHWIFEVIWALLDVLIPFT